MIQKMIAQFLSIVKGQTIKQLRKKGAIIGEDVNLLNAVIDVNTACLIEIGSHVTITNATIYAHDASTKIHLGYTKIAKTTIGDYVFIGAGSIILPGVLVGSNVIIGAGSVVRNDIPNNSVVIGNPASVVCTVEEYVSRNREKLKKFPVYDKTIREMSIEEKMEISKEVCIQGGGYEL